MPISSWTRISAREDSRNLGCGPVAKWSSISPELGWSSPPPCGRKLCCPSSCVAESFCDSPQLGRLEVPSARIASAPRLGATKLATWKNTEYTQLLSHAAPTILRLSDPLHRCRKSPPEKPHLTEKPPSSSAGYKGSWPQVAPLLTTQNGKWGALVGCHETKIPPKLWGIELPADALANAWRQRMGYGQNSFCTATDEEPCREDDSSHSMIQTMVFLWILLLWDPHAPTVEPRRPHPSATWQAVQ